MNRWPHQLRGVLDVLDAFSQGYRHVCLQSPTGAGKSLMMFDLAVHFLKAGGKVAIYSNRKMLIDQLSEKLIEAGLYHGVRAAEYADERDHPLQVCSMPTEVSRSLKKKVWELHATGPDDLAIIDESHLHLGETACTIRQRHHRTLDVTATPVGMGAACDYMVQAGTMQELRDCGALVRAEHYGPDEPDLMAHKKALAAAREGSDYTAKQLRQLMMVPGFFGRVWEWFEKLNPERRPTILFAPGVEESIYFAEQFTKHGVSAAHIDGEDIWVNGNLYQSSRELRQEVLEGSRAGTIGVLCNRFVLREGIDAPWLGHGIFATVFGSLQSYLQSGGRLLRNHPSLESVTIQDMGGNWWRHGSLNDDRHWSLDTTAASAYGIRADRIRNHEEREPQRCPKCSRIVRGRTCLCGHQLDYHKKSRPVVGTDGKLRHLSGDIFRRRRTCRKPNGPQLWERMYWRSKTEKGARTFRQAYALFAQENDWGWPDTSWPFMPRRLADSFKLVGDVPMDDLIPKEVPV